MGVPRSGRNRRRASGRPSWTGSTLPSLERLTCNLAQLGSQSSSLASRIIRLMQLENEARSAQIVYEQFLSRAKEFDGRSQLLRPLVQFVAHAAVPGEPSFPDRTCLALGGIIFGLLAGLGYVLAHEHLMRGFSNLSRVSQELAVPLLCAVPVVGRRKGPARDRRLRGQAAPVAGGRGHAGAGDAPAALGGERGARPGALAGGGLGDRQGGQDDGLPLAGRAPRQSGLRVLLIDGDHRRGAVAARLGGCTDAGFAEVLNGTAALGDVTQHADALGIDFVGSGQPMACVSSGAGLRRLRELLGGLRGRYDFRAARLPRGGCRERRARVPGVAGGAAGRGGGEPGRLAGLAASVPPGASLAMRLVGLSFREWWRMVSPGLLASLLMLLGLGLLSPVVRLFGASPARGFRCLGSGVVSFILVCGQQARVPEHG